MAGTRPNQTSFKPGQAGGPGRPRALPERRFLQLLTDAVTNEDWKEVVETALDQAKSALPAAARHLPGLRPPPGAPRSAPGRRRGIHLTGGAPGRPGSGPLPGQACAAGRAVGSMPPR
jgi:hypothetical protein